MILYRCPDAEVPSSGVRTLVRHVCILRKAGISSQLEVQGTRGLSRWLPLEANLVSGHAPKDTLRVVPETDLAGLSQPGPKVIFAQSYLFKGSLPPGRRWKDSNVVAVMTLSDPLAAFIEKEQQIIAAVIPPSLDTQLFRPLPKERIVAYMPRRNRIGIEEILKRASLAEFQPVAIDRQPLPEVARILGKASVFLAGSRSEGFGMPALEALASGCLVCGFAAGGGRHFLENGVNALLVEDGNVDHAAQVLSEGVRQVARGDHEPLIRNGIETAAVYTAEREEEGVLRFWRHLLVSKA